MTEFSFKNKGKAFISLTAVVLLSSLFISGCGQAPQDQAQSSLVDKQSSITAADNNHRLFFKSSHNEIKFGYAVQSCFVKLGGNFLVDGYNSFCGEYNQNQNISTGGVAYVNEIKINGRNVRITGQVVQVQTCEVDISQIIEKAGQSNNNSVVPSQFIRDGKLKLENNDRLTLPSGVYYFKEIKVSGRAVLEFSGLATVVVEGDVGVEGQGQIKTNPVFLRIISTGRVKVEGQGSIYAGIVGNEVKVGGKGQVFGGVISREFKGEGQGAVHFDKGLGLDRIEVFPSEVTIKVGETVQLTALAKDIFGNEISCVGFEWSSSDQSVAVVDQSGLVQGVGEGRAIVSATAKKEGYSLDFKGEAVVNVVAGIQICSTYFPSGPRQYIEENLFFDSLQNCLEGFDWVAISNCALQQFLQGYEDISSVIFSCILDVHGWEWAQKFNRIRIDEPGTYYLVYEGGAFSWGICGGPRLDWTWCQQTIFVTDDGEGMYFRLPCYSPTFFSNSTEVYDFFGGYTVTLTAPKSGYLYVGVGDSYCPDNFGIVYNKIIPAEPYPSFITVDSRHACSWVRGAKEYKLGTVFPFTPGKYKLIIENGGYKNSGLSPWDLYLELINSGCLDWYLVMSDYMLSHGEWRWHVKIVVDGTGESFDLGGEADFNSYDELISYWGGKHITIDVPPGCNGVWFYVPDDICEDNIGNMLIRVEKLD